VNGLSIGLNHQAVGNVAVHDFSRVSLGGAIQAFAVSADGYGTLTINCEVFSLTASGHSTVISNGLNVHDGPIIASDFANVTLYNLNTSPQGGITVLDSANVTLWGGHHAGMY
jgi:hypothetical protein